MSRPKKPGRRRGRPPGQKNYKYEPIEVVPAACPSCGVTDLEHQPGPPVREWIYAGKTKTGQPFDRITWKSRRCRQCGQRLTVRYYEQKSPITNIISGGKVENDEPEPVN